MKTVRFKATVRQVSPEAPWLTPEFGEIQGPATPLGGHWREPSEIEYRGWNLSHSRRRPHEIVEFVLGELLALWGCEADPVVMAEVHARRRAMRISQPANDRP